jgi:hypothetical protein
MSCPNAIRPKPQRHHYQWHNSGCRSLENFQISENPGGVSRQARSLSSLIPPTTLRKTFRTSPTPGAPHPWLWDVGIAPKRDPSPASFRPPPSEKTFRTSPTPGAPHPWLWDVGIAPKRDPSPASFRPPPSEKTFRTSPTPGAPHPWFWDVGIAPSAIPLQPHSAHHPQKNLQDQPNPGCPTSLVLGCGYRAQARSSRDPYARTDTPPGVTLRTPPPANVTNLRQKNPELPCSNVILGRWSRAGVPHNAQESLPLLVYGVG